MAKVFIVLNTTVFYTKKKAKSKILFGIHNAQIQIGIIRRDMREKGPKIKPLMASFFI